jgi:hypothetical protein
VSNVNRLLVAAVVTIMLIGCTDDGVSDTGTESGPTTSKAASTSSTAPTTTVPTSSTVADAVIKITDQPGEGEFEGALDDVESDCALDGAKWVASGTVTNSTNGPVGYRIFVSFLDAGGETLALIQADADLAGIAAGDAREWSVEFDSDTAGLKCVLRVERRPA